jgi:MFS transporter, DHA2 family, multidrug resistance protein
MGCAVALASCAALTDRELPPTFKPASAHAPSAAGLMKFPRTLSGAIATSIVTTAWDDGSAAMHAELAGPPDLGGELSSAMRQALVLPDAARKRLDRPRQGQSLVLTTNHIMSAAVLALVVSAMMIWRAPRPTRAVEIKQAGNQAPRRCSRSASA